MIEVLYLCWSQAIVVALLLLLGESVAAAPGDEDRECDSFLSSDNPSPHLWNPINATALAQFRRD